MARTPKIIFFDAAGTLFHLPRGVGAHYREVALRHGLDRPAEELERAFRIAWKASTPPATTRLPRPDDDKGWWRHLVTQVFPRTLARDEEDQLFEELYAEFTKPGIWELYPEVLEVLQELSGSFRLGVISNFDGRLRHVLRNLGVLGFFDPIVISSEVGADKPDPYIYQRAAELAGVDLGDALHVGDDSECDWEGARAAGMVSHELYRPYDSLSKLLRLIED